MTKCPHCFITLDNRFAAMCRNRCSTQPDERATLLHGSPVENPKIGHFQADPSWVATNLGGCPDCDGPLIECCPNCHMAFPPEWRAGQATCIALAGARATGKSVYIGVLVKLLELFADAHGTTVEFADGASRQMYENIYEKPLYEARGIIPPTPRANLADPWPRSCSRTVPRCGGSSKDSSPDVRGPPHDQMPPLFHHPRQPVRGHVPESVFDAAR